MNKYNNFWRYLQNNPYSKPTEMLKIVISILVVYKKIKIL